MSALDKYLDEMRSIFKKREEDYTYTNIEGTEMPIKDYLDDSIPKKRVKSDAKKMLTILRNAKQELSSDDFYIIIAAYCNYYIEEGIMFKIEQEYYGLSEFFNMKDNNDITFLVCDGVIRQDYDCFEKILMLDPNCTVANVYLFVRNMSELTYQISIDNTESIDGIEKKVWGYYEQLNAQWKKYVIQEHEQYPYTDKSPIPYIFCGKKETSHYEDMLIDYMVSILDKLDIQDFEPSNLYNIIKQKYHVQDSFNPLKNFSISLQNSKVPSNDIENLDVSIQEEIHDNFMKACMQMAEAIAEGLENRCETEFDMRCLFEKLGYLVQMTDQDRKEDHKFYIYDFPCEGDSLLDRYAYVHIPMVTCESISMRQLLDRYRLFSTNRELENKIKALNHINKQRAKMINQLEHSWGNESYPEIVKDVANSLNEQNHNTLANKLFMAYESETIMMGQVIILQALMSDDLECLKDIFKRSFFTSGIEKVGYKVDELFRDCLIRLISNLVNSSENGTKKKNKCREKLFSKYDEAHITSSFYEYLKNSRKNSNQDNTIFNWFSRNVFDMSFSIDSEWMKVNFGLTQDGRVIFENILMEIFTNILFHGKEYCNIRLTCEDDKYIIQIENGISDSEHGSQNGLESMSNLIDKLNYRTNVLEKEGVVCHNVDKNIFVTTITLAKELMYLEGWF